MRLATLIVMTPDLAEARRFYGEALGFPVVSASEDMLVLQHEGAAFHVFRCEAPAPPARHGRDAASVFAFEVEDVEVAMRELKAKGVQFIHERPAENAFGRYAAFLAPGGLAHELFEPKRDESPLSRG